MRKYYPIRVYDSCISDKLLNAIVEKYETSFSYGWKANRKNNEDQGHWNVPICIEDVKCLEDIAPKLSIKDEHIHALWLYLKKYFIGERKLSRVYINGYTYGTDGYIHRDDKLYDELGAESPFSETVIIYLNNEWEMNWGGETVIVGNDGEISKSVIPKFTRMLIFDGQMQHASRPLSRICKDLRMVLVFKTVQSAQKNLIDNVYDLTINNEHSGRTFFEHLVGTSAIALKLGASDDVINACLFHSIYGTEFYKNNIVITRDQVREWIGINAELLAYTYCVTTNRFETFINGYIGKESTNSSFYKDLLFVEYCNILEQNPTSSRLETLKRLIFL